MREVYAVKKKCSTCANNTSEGEVYSCPVCKWAYDKAARTESWMLDKYKKEKEK